MAQAANKLRLRILSFLFSKGVYAWPENVGAIPLGHGRFRGAAKKGVSDVLGIIPPSGRALAIEIKIGSDRLSPEQEGFLHSVEAAGGLAYIARDYDEFVKWYGNAII